jgi:hypothetical protein
MRECGFVWNFLSVELERPTLLLTLLSKPCIHGRHMTNNTLLASYLSALPFGMELRVCLQVSLARAPATAPRPPPPPPYLLQQKTQQQSSRPFLRDAMQEAGSADANGCGFHPDVVDALQE